MSIWKLLFAASQQIKLYLLFFQKFTESDKNCNSENFAVLNTTFVKKMS